MKNLCSGTQCGGFQFLLILDLWGISFHAAIVFGLGKNLLFKSVLGHCVLIDYNFSNCSKICFTLSPSKQNLLQYPSTQCGKSLLKGANYLKFKYCEKATNFEKKSLAFFFIYFKIFGSMDVKITPDFCS